MAFPITIKDLVANPLQSIILVLMIAVSIMYADLRVTYNKRDREQTAINAKLSERIDIITKELMESNNERAALKATIDAIKKYGKIE